MINKYGQYYVLLVTVWTLPTKPTPAWAQPLICSVLCSPVAVPWLKISTLNTALNMLRALLLLVVRLYFIIFFALL